MYYQLLALRSNIQLILFFTFAFCTCFFASCRAFITWPITHFWWINLMMFARIFALHDANIFTIVTTTRTYGCAFSFIHVHPRTTLIITTFYAHGRHFRNVLRTHYMHRCIFLSVLFVRIRTLVRTRWHTDLYNHRNSLSIPIHNLSFAYAISL